MTHSHLPVKHMKPVTQLCGGLTCTEHHSCVEVSHAQSTTVVWRSHMHRAPQLCGGLTCTEHHSCVEVSHAQSTTVVWRSHMHRAPQLCGGLTCTEHRSCVEVSHAQSTTVVWRSHMQSTHLRLQFTDTSGRARCGVGCDCLCAALQAALSQTPVSSSCGQMCGNWRWRMLPSVVSWTQ